MVCVLTPVCVCVMPVLHVRAHTGPALFLLMYCMYEGATQLSKIW